MSASDPERTVEPWPSVISHYSFRITTCRQLNARVHDIVDRIPSRPHNSEHQESAHDCKIF
jgi:hypothetical protein